MNYERHPLSAAWPNMSAEEFISLTESIQMHGLREPVVLMDGMVLDGWHRYQACLEAGMQSAFIEFDGDDAKEFVSDKHNRRSLTLTQRMTAIALMNQFAPSGGGGKKSRVEPSATLTHADLAKQAGGSAKTAQQVKSAISKGTKEVVKAMQDGTLSAKRAAEISKLPEEEQAKAIAEPVAKAPAAAYDPREDELRETQQTLADIAAENEDLRDRLAVGVMSGTDAEKAEAAQTIADLRQQVKTLEAEAIALRSSRDHYQREASELRKQIKMNERELKKARAPA